MTDFKPGDIVFRHEVPGSSKSAIAMFSIATEDPNPIHTDEQFARDCGFPQVIQQGPMTTAHFARLLAETVGAIRLKVLDLSFTAPVFPEEPLTLTATVGKIEDNITIDLSAAKKDGTVTAKGFALIAPTIPVRNSCKKP
jgi:acyl dehydratase